MIDREYFFKMFRKFFGKVSQSQVDALNFLMDCYDASAVLTRLSEFAYVLATIFHETAYTMRPIEERGSYNYFKYLIGKLGITSLAMANKYKGRGYVQLTGFINYLIFKVLLGIDLENYPEKALEPDTAWKITEIGMSKGKFTGKKLSDYINGSKREYVNARRIINGKDRAVQIAGYANNFWNCLQYQQ